MVLSGCREQPGGWSFVTSHSRGPGPLWDSRRERLSFFWGGGSGLMDIQHRGILTTLSENHSLIIETEKQETGRYKAAEMRDTMERPHKMMFTPVHWSDCMFSYHRLFLVRCNNLSEISILQCESRLSGFAVQLRLTQRSLTKLHYIRWSFHSCTAHMQFTAMAAADLPFKYSVSVSSMLHRLGCFLRVCRRMRSGTVIMLRVTCVLEAFRHKHEK